MNTVSMVGSLTLDLEVKDTRVDAVCQLQIPGEIPF
jgi:hypothetical protein